MSEQPDLQAIREFLTEQKYRIHAPSPKAKYSKWRFSYWLKWQEIHTEAKSEQDAMRQALNHYLSTQLGVHWHIEFKNAHFTYKVSDVMAKLNVPKEVRKQIFRAIDYLEKLEKGAGE